MSKYKYPNKIPFHEFILNSSKIAKNPIPFQNKWLKQNNNVFYVKPYFQESVIITCKSEIAKDILQKKHKHFHKSKIQTQFLSKYIGYGLLTSSGDYWLQQRRLIQPGFHRDKIKNLVDVIDTTIKTQLKIVPLNKEVDLYSIMHELAFEVVAKSLFNFSTEKNTLKRLQFIIEKLQQFITIEIRQPYKKLGFLLSGKYKYHNKLVKESREIIENIIIQRKTTNQEHDDLLQMLLDSKYEDGSSMTNEQLIDEIMILFVAGHETTANALTFILTLLAKHKDVLNKVEAEVEQVSSTTNDALQSISSLTYLTNCINESLRLYPPAWITDRVAVEDIQLQDFYIKKGTMIGISIYELHRNSANWKNPNQFIPERFIDNPELLKSDAYMPFGAGPRLCIGNNFAMFEMVLTVFEIIKKFKISTTTETIKVNPLITLKPVGLTLKFKNR
jgi:cytochrome P450